MHVSGSLQRWSKVSGDVRRGAATADRCALGGSTALPPCTCAIAMARHTASNCEKKTIQVVGNMIERPRAHSPACRLLKRVLQNSQMAVRGSLARAQRQWKCEAVSGSHALLSGRGKSQDRGAFNALHAKGGSGAPHAAHAQQMSKQAAKREAISRGSLSDRRSVLGDSHCKRFTICRV